MSHPLRWSAAALLTVGMGVGTARHFHLFAGSESTAVPIHEVQRRYDDTSTSSTADDTATSVVVGVRRLPDPGVYEYVTTGRDSVDALTGAHHDYPATTTITVTATACGAQQRWDVLVQRWEVWQRCATELGIRETERTNYDEFFGQGQTDAWTCAGDARPLEAALDTAWSTTCSGTASTEVRSGVVVGHEAQVVGTSTVDTLHVRTTITDDTPTDRQVIDTWYLAGTDLIVAQTSDVSTSNDSPVGTVHYLETYEIHLVSLTPHG